MTEGRLAPEEVRTRTFTRVVRGYRRREVRRLLEQAAADLARLRDGPSADGPDDRPFLTPEQVEEARFQPALGGYEMDEVDRFLDKVVAELERSAREPFRPASALPAPPRHPPPAATPGATPGAPEPHAPGPGAPEREGSRSLGSGDPAVHSPPAAPAPPPAVPVLPMAATEPPVASLHSPAATPRPPAAEPSAAAGPPAPAPAAPDEGFFPPPSVPPSAAPPPVPPPPPAPRAPVATPGRPLTPSEVETRSFQRGAPGYLPSHVDLFLAKAARALAGRDGETLTRWDVLRQRFPLGPRGYATSEVDAFLVRLAAQFPDPDPAAQREILRKLEGG
jgi:DivIVA domain-containing protein